MPTPPSARFDRATKIVATIGPASGAPDMLRALFEAGANVFRLNFSHGTHADHAERIKIIRGLEAETGRPTCILADLQGPKHRVGDVEDGTLLSAGERVIFDLNDAPGNASRLGLPHPEIFQAVIPGTRVLMDDGKLELRVVAPGTDQFEAEVVTGGVVRSQKGVNLPDVVLPTKPITPKDEADLAFALAQGVEWVALSFVQRTADILDAKALVKDRAGIIAKIEKPSALAELRGIVDAADGIMVARGDLGVELPPEQVPGWQKKIVAECRMVGKPAIVATQMLESMIDAPAPTRAEASDVAGAVFDGADAVMLSAETAAGSYPVESVSMMARIAAAAEHHIRTNPEAALPELPVEPSIYHAVARSSVALAETVEAKVIVAFSTSGNTAVRIARERPDIPFLVMTPHHDVERKMALLWGTRSAPSAFSDDFESAIEEAVAEIRNRNLAQDGDHVVVIAGMPFGIAGTTNSVRVVTL